MKVEVKDIQKLFDSDGYLKLHEREIRRRYVQFKKKSNKMQCVKMKIFLNVTQRSLSCVHIKIRLQINFNAG
jgi:hypothetical protein